MEHDDVEKTIYLKDTAKFYLKRKFWIDIISIQNYVFRVYVGSTPYITGEIIHGLIHNKNYFTQD